MSGPPDDEIDKVRLPDPDPGRTAGPDRNVSSEQMFTRRHEKMAGSAAFRSIVLAEREAESLRDDKYGLAAECRDLREKLESKSIELVRLTGELADLKRAFQDARGNYGLASLLLVAGGTSVSVAGAIGDALWKPIAFWVGVGLFVAGFLLALWSSFWIRERK